MWNSRSWIDVVQRGVEISGARGWIILARETQQAVHDALHAARFRAEFLHAFRGLLAFHFFAQ